jgi:hypothetical protein
MVGTLLRRIGMASGGTWTRTIQICARAKAERVEEASSLTRRGVTILETAIEGAEVEAGVEVQVYILIDSAKTAPNCTHRDSKTADMTAKKELRRISTTKTELSSKEREASLSKRPKRRTRKVKEELKARIVNLTPIRMGIRMRAQTTTTAPITTIHRTSRRNKMFQKTSQIGELTRRSLVIKEMPWTLTIQRVRIRTTESKIGKIETSMVGRGDEVCHPQLREMN